MKKTFTFWKSLFLLCALIVGSTNGRGQNVIYKTARFGTDYNVGNQVYTGSFEATNEGFTVTATNFNNNQNGWTKNGYGQIKCGRKNNASVATITTKSTIDQAITKVVVTIDAITASDVSSIKLYTSSDNSIWTEIGSFTKSTGDQEVSLSTPTANLYYKVVFDCASGSSNGLVTISKVEYYKVEAPAYNITAQSNNESYGTVSLSGNVITGAPEDGYRYADPAYTVTSGTATVSQSGNEFTVTPSSDCTVQINFEAIPCYTVTFNAEGGTCGTTSATETIGGAGVTLPTATTGVAGWEFIGWAADAVDNTTTQPTLYKAGSTYYPTSATTLHAVYTLSETGSTYARVTSASQIDFAKKIAVASSRSTSRILNHTATTVTAPTETTGEITVSSDQMFTLSGDNTTGYVLTGAIGTLSQETLSASGSGNNDKPIDWTGSNNKWIIETNTNADNLFALRNANSTQVALEFDGGWKTYYVGTYTSSPYTAMKLYIPKTAYNSNPSAIITPTIAFDSADPVTLYLDGTTENTNTAKVTGVSKTINYTSSKTGVATVNSEGVVTAVGIGTTTITASVDAELGVSAPAYDTYEVTVKSATTLAGIKAQATSSTAVDFTADLASDLVITYVNGSHAYLQSGNVAIYASCATDDWTAGKKFTGAISGKVKKLNNEYQITAIDQAPVAGGVVPDAIEVAITDLTTANYAIYEGRKIAINGATISTAMESDETSGGKITTDGNNTLNIYARLTGITLTKDEKGNFVGYIGRYNDGIRYYMYEQSQFTKTHNAPQNQVMSFTNSSYNLDEETDAVTDFAGQEVTKTTVKGTLTYSIKEGSDDIITSLNASTGAVVLNGACGTATIVATASATEVDNGDGYLTPYKELSREYTINVNHRYSVTFSVNGIETVLRQATYGATIAVPTPGDFGDYKFMGWSTSTVAPTDVEPSMTDLGATVIPTDNDDKYYAVYAKQTIVPDVEQTSTFTFQKSSGTSPSIDNEGTWTFGEVEFSPTANCGLKTQSITVTPSANVTSIKEVTVTKTTNAWAKATTLSIVDASDKNLTTLHGGSDNSDFDANNKYTYSLTSNQSSSYTFTSSGSAWIKSITLTYRAPALTYADYCTSLPAVVTVTDLNSASGGNYTGKNYATMYYSDRALAVPAGVVAKTYKMVNGALTESRTYENGGTYPVIPAGEAVVIESDGAADYAFEVTSTETTVDENNALKGTDATTTVDATGYKYYKLSLNNAKNKVGFFFAVSGGTSITNGAHKAYLRVATGGNARDFYLFDDTTTRITNVEMSDDFDDNTPMYNLSGQKVGKSYKGIVVVNGKKVVRK